MADRAIELGTYGYVIKPFTPNQVLIAARNALQRRKLELENRAHRETLEQIVRARTAALERSAKRLKLSREETVRRLSRAVEYRDEETGGHTERMSAYSALLAGKLGLDVESIRIASPMHDVGKVALPDHLLLRPGALTPEERAEMERHTWIGYQILAGSGSALLELGATIALTHHEKWDGTRLSAAARRQRHPDGGPGGGGRGRVRRAHQRPALPQGVLARARPSRSCATSGASTSTRAWSTSSSRTSTSCSRSGTGTRRPWSPPDPPAVVA